MHMQMQDVEFAFLYPEDFKRGYGNLESLIQSDFYKQNQYGIRVYRRSNMGDFRDMLEGKSAEDMQAFVFKSTFVGTGPELIRYIDPENIMKFFSQPDPGLLLFYDPEIHDVEEMELELAFSEIQNSILVMKGNIHESMASNLASLLNVNI